MQSGRFYKLSIAAAVIVTLVVMVMLWNDAADTVPPLEESTPAISTAPSPSSILPTPVSMPRWDDILIQTPKGAIKAELATTTEARTQGLSGTLSMPKDSGMLFVFPNAGVYGFWMKDMLFPIDIVWIDADKRVSGVALGVSPATFPKVFESAGSIKYVLELNSGASLDYGIATGTKLVF